MEKIEVSDIREYKKRMRDICRKERKAMPADYREKLDESIFHRFIQDDSYKNNSIILAYVSTDIEVDTKRIIQYAIDDGKTVAVPLCYPETKEMDFYVITSFDELIDGHYGIKEPDVSRCEKADVKSHTLCIVPGLCFDKLGYRIGYGGGYYDRFLPVHDTERIGLCYSDFIVDELRFGKYDVCMDKVITNHPIERNECVE